MISKYLFSVLMACLCILISVPVLADDENSSSSDNQTHLTLGVIPSGNTSPFHKELIKGMINAAADKNLTIEVRPPDTEENITAQKLAMQLFIDEHVDVICLNTLNTSVLSPEIQAASNAGIPVLVYNTLTPAHDESIAEYIGYNQFTGAAELGSYTARILAEKQNDASNTVQGKTFILRGLPGFHADHRTDGFVTGLSQSPGITITNEAVAGWDRKTAKQIAVQALKDNPAINIFYGNSDEMAIGAAEAVQEQGKHVNSDILCVGIDGNAPTLAMIKNGTMTATLGVYPDRMGTVVVEQAEKVLKGEQVPRYLETPSTVVDSQNLDAYLNGSTWTEPVESVPEPDIR
ncbi:MAG: sugar ABC transporter substrate-binding protein [Methanospirillum sp.]|uniref:sugar ABC transporter substrate-binding protein n=1 Tax=Methanospirillum sp. TaxID=45200 RepID=UPI002371EC90|nr:sugar ABC transporter substrate-binding protein [Methanospirillum sp.]MDD1729187.1 sugar ABC transporter substrate-binding protein [Methanospirillum sp.]